jgi:cytochrome c oxidase cbb3-type subunit I/II
MPFETLRYGEASTLADSAFDHPFQWGSKRTGPDLAREGGKYPHLWHYRHLVDPRAITEGSNMPSYAHLATEKVDLTLTNQKLSAMRSIGVPYTNDDIATAQADANAQGELLVKDLAAEGVQVAPDTSMVAVIAYLQRLGKKTPLVKPSGPVAVLPDTNGGVK